MRRTTAAALVTAVHAAVLAGALAGGGLDHRLMPGQTATGSIGETGEEDLLLLQTFPGQKITVQIKARSGESLLPELTSLLNPAEQDVLGSAIVKTSKKGDVVTLKSLVSPSGGTWVLGLGGDGGTTGTYDIKSKGSPSNARLGAGDVASPGAEVPLEFAAEAGSDVAIQVKADQGQSLRPLVARIEGPQGTVNLGSAARKTSAKKDSLKGVRLADNGTYTVFVTGDEGTTGTFTALIKVGKTVPLDFSVDPTGDPPPPGPPAVTAVNPGEYDAPSTGNSMTVTGLRFVSGAQVSFTPATGITGLSTSFNSATSLTATFDVAGDATPGLRSVTVTNPDTQTGTKANAFSVVAGPTGVELNAVTPSSGPGAGGTRVLLQGELFGNVTEVLFGTEPAQAILRVDAENILCTVPPAAAVSATGASSVDVSVEVDGNETATLVGGWTYDADPSPPKVAAQVPALNSTGAPRNLQKVVLFLDERPDPASVVTGNFLFFRSSVSGPNDIINPSVTGVAVGAGGRCIVVQRGGATGGTLSATSTYVTQISNGVTDVAGNPLDPTPFGGSVFQGSFATGAGTDATAPTVVSTTPGASAVGVDMDGTVSILFSEAIDPSLLAGAFSLKQGPTNIPGDLDVDQTLTTATFTPRFRLAPSTTYTIGIATTLRDLSANALATALSRTFTTAAADGTAPTAVLTVDVLPQDMNGSGTYVNSGGTGGNAFDAYLPRSGFTIDLEFTDAGGSAVDASSLTVTCDRAMGSVSGGAELAGFFTATPLGGTWTVPAANALAVNSNVTFTARVSDNAGNQSPQVTLVVDVADITKSTSGGSANASTDRDPFNVRQVWLLRFDQDIYATSSTGSSTITVNSSLPGGGNGTLDLREDLALVGLNGTESGTGAASVTNGSSTGTNAIVQRIFRESVRGYLNLRYGIAFDGTRSADSVDVEFLLAGEQGSLSAVPDPATWNSGRGYSMLSCTGDESPNSSNTAIGRANFDLRNTQQDDDSNTGVGGGNNLGAFLTHMIRKRINDSTGTLFRDVFDPLIPARSGTAVGASNLDATVLSGSFNYATATQPQKDRFDLIMTAIDHMALYLSFVAAHEVGHSVGLVADGAPPAGLFGGSHEGNTFITDGGFTTSGHIDTPGNNLMEAASPFSEAVAQGSAFARFGPMNAAWLLRRFVYDQ